MAQTKKMEAAENENALKHLFNSDLLKRVSKALREVYPAFDSKKFQTLSVLLGPLEMKPRVLLIRDQLREQLPAAYPQALSILLKSLRKGNLRGFDLWPYTEFVQTYGLQMPEISLAALEEMTKLFTAEWGVRPFIKTHPELTMKYLLACAANEDVHVRRWASEGSRPRLPWGERLQDFVRDPRPTLPILEKLKFDEELYVRKSVANHLNDIAKDHPDLVVKILAGWKKTAGNKHATKVEWIIYRSLRTLIKAGHPGALKLIGVTKADVKLVNFKIKQKKVRLGERMDFAFQIRSLSGRPQKLVVDYIVHFVKSNRQTAPKVFKLRTVEIAGQEILQLAKSHHFKKITTREYYSGIHHLEIQINGLVVGKASWLLEV